MSFRYEVAIEFNSDTEYSPESLESMIADMSAAGLYVEVEGTYADDMLIVYEIKLEDDDAMTNFDLNSLMAGDSSRYVRRYPTHRLARC